MLHTFSNHLRLQACVIGSALTLVAAFNLVADPYRCFRCFNVQSLNESSAGASTRTGKGEMVARRDWDILLLGTSRVEGSLNPMHPAFAGARVYNAGLSGADYPELDRIARAAMKRGTLKRLILCPELFCFDPDWRSSAAVDPSPADPALNHAEYYLANLLSLRATTASLDTFCDARRNILAKDYPLGLFAPHVIPGPHTRTRWALGALKLTLPDGIDQPGASPVSTDRFLALGELLDEASRNRVKVDIVHLPMHAVALEGYAVLNIWPLYELWIRSLCGVVAGHNEKFPGQPATFWDFCRYNPITTDSSYENSNWFYDSFHLKVPLGDQVIDQIMRGDPPGRCEASALGVMVDPSNLESHLAELRRDRMAYCAANPEVKQIDAEILRAYREQN